MEDVIKRKKGKWYKTMNSYIEELNITWDMLYTMTKKEIKVLTKRHDNTQWENELNERKTLKYYKVGKRKIGYDHCYRNNVNSQFLAMARINAIGLEEALGKDNVSLQLEGGEGIFFVEWKKLGLEKYLRSKGESVNIFQLAGSPRVECCISFMEQ